MEETNVQNIEQVESENAENTQEQTPDLMTRVSSFAKDNDSKKGEGDSIEDDFKFDVNDIEKIEDPQARAYAEKAYKSLNKGFQEKFREVAELRKQFEHSNQQQGWDKDRIESLLKDPEFVKAAQEVAGVQGNYQESEEYSGLSDSERKKLDEAFKIADTLQKQNQQLLIQQEHEQLKSKYKDYNAQEIDQIRGDLMSGKIQATSEHLYKAFNFDKAVQNAYELGLQDRQNDNIEKINSSSATGYQVSSDQTIKREEGESNHSFMQRIIAKNLKPRK